MNEKKFLSKDAIVKEAKAHEAQSFNMAAAVYNRIQEYYSKDKKAKARLGTHVHDYIEEKRRTAI